MSADDNPSLTRALRAVKAEALREAADDPRLVGLRPGTQDWLRARADEIEAAS